MSEWLTFIGNLVSALAWPTAVVWLLLAYKKPVRKILVAVAKRVADLEEVSSPVGGAKFSDRVKEVAEKLQESIEDSETDDDNDHSEEEIPAPSSEESDSPGPGETRPAEPSEAKRPENSPPEDHGSTSTEESAGVPPVDRTAPRDSNSREVSRRPRPKTAEEIAKNWSEIFGRLRGGSPLTRMQPSGSKWSKFESTVLDLAKLSPRAAVMEAWSEVEKSAVLMIGVANPHGDNVMVHRFGRTMSQMGLPSFWIEAFEGLRRLRNYAAHEVAFSASPEDVRQYAATAWTLKEGFDEVAGALRETERQQRYLDER
jgi:hypothetical protein